MAEPPFKRTPVKPNGAAPGRLRPSGSRGVGSGVLATFPVDALLGRPPVDLDLALPTEWIAGKRVLITGAGGSIGSELARQVALLGCTHVGLLDNCEFNLFEIDRELDESHPGLSREAVLCDIRDGERLERWMARERPDVIFHAAALKHVSLVEKHPCEGVLTNVAGTANVALAARRHGVADLVLISTDKAVSPNNVMGATKRLTEQFVRGLAEDSRSTRFHVVRFGNVLGSAGSAAPVFQAQIERGGPIRVTHTDVERYFMTIPEAVQLLLLASATGAQRPPQNCSVFVLEMGEPVRIVDLARRMIELNGLKPDEDIEIVIVGLRVGEKLSEDLVDWNEEAVAGGVEGIVEVRPLEREILTEATVRDLERMARRGDDEAVRAKVFGLLRTAVTSDAGSPVVQPAKATSDAA